MTSTDQRNHHRFTTCDGKQLPVLVRHTSADSEQAGHVVDISVDGARLALRRPARVGEQVEVDLNSSALHSSEPRNATVCWTALTRDFLWQTGIQFSEPLHDTTLDTLASAGIVERRRQRRIKVSVPATIRLEACSQTLAARMGDISSGGLGLISPQPLELNQRIMVTVDDPAEPLQLLALVRSCRRYGREHAIGCEFVDRDVYRQLLRFIQGNRQRGRKPRQFRLRDYICTAVSTLLCMVVAMQWHASPGSGDAGAGEQHMVRASVSSK